MRHINKFIAISLGVALSTNVLAFSYGTFDTKGAGMGGIGIATSDISNAPFNNPGLLAVQDRDDNFTLTFPSLGIYINADKDLVSNVDDFKTAVNSGDLATADSLINSITGSSLLFGAMGSSSIGFSAENYNGAINISRYAEFGTQLSGTDNTDAAINVIGYEIEEISYSTAMKLGSKWYIGANIKSQTVNTYEYIKSLATISIDANGLTGDTGRSKYTTSLNIDIGTIYDFGNGWKTAFVAKNLANGIYKTVNNSNIHIKPNYKFGFGYKNDWLTLGSEVDLTKQNIFTSNNEIQILNVGTEINIWNSLKVRLGHIENISPSATTEKISTSGIGFTAFGVGVDLSVQTNKNHKAAYLQLGFGF